MNNDPSQPSRRKKLIIDPQFQFGFLKYSLGITFGTIAIWLASNFYFFSKFEKIGTDLNLPTNHIFFVFIAEQKHAMNSIVLVTSIIILLLLVSSGIVYSHRIVGPLIKLKNYMNDLAENKDEKALSFRKNDYFVELAESFNRLRDRVKNK